MDRAPAISTLTLDQQYDAIVACCDDLLLVERRATSTGDVGQLRIRLATLLHANLSLEETSLLGPIRRLASAARPIGFAELGVEAADLRRQYSDHVGRWSLTQIADDRAGYVSAVGALVMQLKTHIARKRSVLPAWRGAIA